MIQIVGFDDLLAPDVKRGRVKHPRWFRQKCQLSPEASLLLTAEDGPALFGIWCLLQQWAMRHSKRGGKFVTLSGEPMSVTEIAVLIGVPGRDHLVRACINRVTNLGWMQAMTDSTPTPEDVHEESIETPQELQGNSILEEKRGDETRPNSDLEDEAKNQNKARSRKIVKEMVDLMTNWKGSAPGILEARLIDSVVQMATESPVGENCPQIVCTALLRHAADSGVEYTTAESGKRYLTTMLDRWRIDGEIPDNVETEPDHLGDGPQPDDVPAFQEEWDAWES